MSIALGLGTDGCFDDLSLLPTEVTGATLQGWYRSTENVLLGGSLIITAGTGPTMTLSGSVLQSLGIRVQITPDATHYRYSINNGTTWLEENLPTSSTPHAIGSTGINLTLPAGAYTNGTIEEVIASEWRDKTAGGRNFTNGTAGTRPRVFVNGQNALPLLRFNGTNMRLVGPASLAQDVFASAGTGGVNTPFYLVSVFRITTPPAGAAIMSFYSASHSTDPNIPLVELQATSTRWRARRRANAGTDIITNASPALVPQLGIYVVEDEFDGVNRRISVNTVDIIGGTSGVKAPQAIGAALSLNQISIACRASNAGGGTGNFQNGDWYELALFSGVPPTEQKLGLVNYLMQRYGFGDRSAKKVNVCFIDFAGGTKGRDHGFLPTMINPADPDSIKTRFGYRQQMNQDGVPYWYTEGTGDLAQEQSNFDGEQLILAEAGAGTIVRAMDFYPTDDLIVSGSNWDPSSTIWIAGFHRLQTSIYKDLTRFCLILISAWCKMDVNGTPAQTTGTWLNLPNFISYLLSTVIQQPGYLILKGNRPLIILFDATGNDWDATHVNRITTAVQAAGYGAPVYVECNERTSQIVPLGLEGITSYGPSGGTPTGATNQHVPYSAQITADRANFLKLANSKAFPPLTVDNDARPDRGEPPLSYYADAPVWSELYQHVRDWFAFVRMNATINPDMCGLWFSWNEWAEGGDTGPTAQTRFLGPFASGVGYKLETLMAVANSIEVTSAWDHHRAYTLHASIVRSAGWTMVQDLWDHSGEGAAFAYAEMQSSTIGATITINPVATDGSALTVDAFELWGSIGPGLGSFNVAIDGGAPVLVSLSAVSLQRSQRVFQSGPLTPGVHSLVLTVVSGPVGLDRLPYEVVYT